MTNQSKFWEIIRNNLPRDRWMLLEEIYDLIERNCNLDYEDYEPQSPKSYIPKWKRNVRNVLQYRKIKDILWDGDAGYKIN